jgi:hypothetical protein
MISTGEWFGVPDNLTASHGQVSAPDPTQNSAHAGNQLAVKWQAAWQSALGRMAPDTGRLNYVSSACLVYASPRASAFDLQFFAEKRLAEVTLSGEATPTEHAVAGLRSVVRGSVEDNGPTPQVGPTQSGSVEVQWLAGGIFVAALFDGDGNYNLCAMDPNLGVLFDEDVPRGHVPSTEVQGKMHSVLASMKSHVISRPAAWY